MSILTAQVEALLEEKDLIACLSNISACLNENLSDINWVGFYFMKQNELVLGPFQGKVACTHIPLDKGVCGKCASDKQTQRIDDVHAFPGHIACDSASSSELVVPILRNDAVWGLIDIDSPYPCHFTKEMEEEIQIVAKQIEERLKIEE